MTDAIGSVAVLGAGGVGGLIAGALARAGADVTVVASEASAAAIAADGLTVRSVRLGEFEVRPAATPRLEHDVDLLVVATKATGLEAALDRVAATPRLVVPLLNGLDHVALLRGRWPDAVAAATIRIESVRVEPTVIEHRSAIARVDLAPPTPDVEAAAHLLRSAEISAKVLEREADVIWGKLVRINALASVTTAFGVPLGEVVSHPRGRLALEGCLRETAAVAVAEGASVDLAAELEAIAAMEPTFTSSMYRDVAAGRAPELDAICGAVLRAAARHGLECPTLEELVGMIRQRLS